MQSAKFHPRRLDSRVRVCRVSKSVRDPVALHLHRISANRTIKCYTRPGAASQGLAAESCRAGASIVLWLIRKPPQHLEVQLSAHGVLRVADVLVQDVPVQNLQASAMESSSAHVQRQPGQELAVSGYPGATPSYPLADPMRGAGPGGRAARFYLTEHTFPSFSMGWAIVAAAR